VISVQNTGTSSALLGSGEDAGWLTMIAAVASGSATPGLRSVPTHPYSSRQDLHSSFIAALGGALPARLHRPKGESGRQVAGLIKF
jgi:hypothetical protein